MGAAATLSFNPTLVRLRLVKSIRPRRGHVLFQSHAGSIEAGEISREGLAFRIGFNPTLVRLRQRIATP